jgi:predicted nucleic acid-binding protein
MASLILPDSNIYIGAVRAGRDPFREFAAGIEDRDWEFATCGMIVLEVCRGQRDPDLLARYRECFGVMIFIPTTRQIWDRAAQLAWSLDRQGRVLPAPDVLIAAHALHSGAAVLTADAHFSAIPGLRVLSALP